MRIEGDIEGVKAAIKKTWGRVAMGHKVAVGMALVIVLVCFNVGLKGHDEKSLRLAQGLASAEMGVFLVGFLPREAAELHDHEPISE
jgi:hypothetical protein